jgi:hypothetical protein
MFNRKLLYIASAIVILGVLATASTGAVSYKRTAYLTFNKPVGLPGVSLAPGTYTFELPDPDGAWNVVRVSSRDGRHVYLTAFTRPIQRPATMPSSQMIMFGEASANAPTPIKAWFPQDDSTGRQFIY